MIQIAPSLLSADFSKLAEEVQSLEACGADVLHLDVMDGHYVPNLTFGAPIIQAIRPHTSLPFDVHLMVTNPEDYITPLAKIGVSYITVHAETTTHLHKVVQEIKSHGIRAGVAINPGTPVSWLEAIAPDVDMILIMSVNPGFGGQSFIPHAVSKIAEARALLDRVGNTEAIIEVDGGIHAGTAPSVIAAGATLLVAGSAVFGAPDRKAIIEQLRQG